MKRLLSLFLSIALTFCIVALFLWANGYSPWLTAYTIIESTWFSKSGFILVLSKTSIFILTGLAVVIPFRAGLFNIGGEGQMIAGALIAAVIGTIPMGPLGFLHIVIALLSGVMLGGLWGGLAGWLKTSRGIHEVISTIMLNFVAFRIVNELTFSIFNAGESASRTAMIADSARLPVLLKIGASNTSIGIVIAMGLAIVLSVLLSRTWPGFHLRAVGANPHATESAGISSNRVQFWAMCVGGACAGLAGSVQSLGVDHTFYARFVGGGGFDGIAVAFLALVEPWATIPAALLIATLRASDRVLQLDIGLPKEFVFMLEGVLIISIAIFARKISA